VDLFSNDENMTNRVIQSVAIENVQIDDLLSLYVMCEVQGDGRMNTLHLVRSRLCLSVAPMYN